MRCIVSVEREGTYQTHYCKAGTIRQFINWVRIGNEETPYNVTPYWDTLELEDNLMTDKQIDSMVMISASELKQLRDAATKLEALEAAGVDNWEWYDDVMAMISVSELEELRNAASKLKALEAAGVDNRKRCDDTTADMPNEEDEAGEIDILGVILA